MSNPYPVEEKALLEVSLSLGPEGRQINTLCKIDSGAETNILPNSLYQQLNPGRMGLAQPTTRLSAYGGVEIRNLGSCQIYKKGPNNPSPRPIQAEVVDVDGPAIIGNMSAQNLNLLRLNWPITANQYSGDLISHRGTPTPQVNHTRPTHDLQTVRLFDMRGKHHPFPFAKDYLLKEYEYVFTGIGCFSGAPKYPQYNIHQGRFQYNCSKPIEELDQLKKWGILSEVRNEYTPWVNSTFVTIKPNGSIRLCLDPGNLNKAVKRNPYYVKMIDDAMPKVSGSTHLSILDARSGFWQVNRDEESRRLCTFNSGTRESTLKCKFKCYINP